MKKTPPLVCLILLFVLGFGVAARAQGALDREVTGDYKEATLIEMLLDLESRYAIKFYYEPQYLPYYKIDYAFTDKPLFGVLNALLPENGLTSVAQGTDGVIICRKVDLNRPYLQGLVERWENDQVALPEFLQPKVFNLDCRNDLSKKLVIKGHLVDGSTLEPIAGATVLGPAGLGASSNNSGNFNLQIDTGNWDFKIRYPGYRETVLHFSGVGSCSFDIDMEQSLQNLREVVIKGNKAADKQEVASAGIEALPTTVIKSLPAFMGEADLVKSLSILPGVTTVGEGAAGFNVRGGNIDQNLVIMDGIPLFNTSHVLGFFSVFNPDLVGTTTLYKGNIPARFGGRASSVLEVQSRIPNFSEWHGSVGAGLSTAKLSLEGPVIPNRMAISLGGRLAFSDWMLKKAKLPKVRESAARFGDVAGSVNIRTGPNGSLVLNGLYSQDYFRYGQDFGYRWANQALSLVYRQLLQEHWLFSAEASSGKLENRYFDPEGSDGFELSSGLQFLRGKMALSTTYWQGHEPRVGVEWNRNSMLQQMREPLGEQSVVLGRATPSAQGDEMAVFVEDDWHIGTHWVMYTGLRYSAYRQLGPGQQFLYALGFPSNFRDVTDTLFFDKGATMYHVGGLEPRVGLQYRINETQSLKFSYNRMRQYLHLISNTSAATPADVWQLSTAYIPPQVSDNFGLGYFRKIEDRRMDASVEAYYKTTKDLPAYRDFAQLLLNEHLETELIAGKGRSYGLEATFNAQTRKAEFHLAYTWSRALQQARSEYPDYSVNFGEWFPANYDQPHQINLFVKYGANPSRYWTFNFSYRQGRPVSAPTSGYTTGNTVVPLYPARNNVRIPDYHRLDVAFTIDKSKRKLDGLRWIASISAYNVYARKNPFSVFFQRDKQGIPKAYVFSTIGTLIPAFNLTFLL